MCMCVCCVYVLAHVCFKCVLNVLYMCMCMCVCECVSVCVCACVLNVYVCVCGRLSSDGYRLGVCRGSDCSKGLSRILNRGALLCASVLRSLTVTIHIQMWSLW